MKKTVLIFYLFFIVISCEKEEINNYNSSLSDWNSLKKTYGNSYKYTTSWSSWVGIGGKTSLIIIDGKVTIRSYESYGIDGATEIKSITETYIETIDNLNTHQDGASVMTIDELYNSCISDYLSVKKKDNTIYFETNDIGIISICGFVPDDCADDCFRGFRIDSFEWL